MSEQPSPIFVPLKLFRDLVWLQAFYAEQLNHYDGGRRRPVELAELKYALTDRERQAREQRGQDIPGPVLRIYQITAAAEAIANARGMRRGGPRTDGILSALPPKLRAEVMEDAKAALIAAGLWEDEEGGQP